MGCSPWNRKKLDMTERLHFHFSLSCIGEGNGNPLQYSCLENPRDGGAWWTAVYGVVQSWTRLKRLSSSSSSPRLGLEPRRKESSKVGMGALIHHPFSLVPSDRISASSPRVVGDARARALCADMKRCSYYETCATYGLNVDRVFQEGELGHPLHVLGSRELRYSSRSHLQASLCERQEISLCGREEGPGRSEKICLIATGPSGQEELARPQ